MHNFILCVQFLYKVISAADVVNYPQVNKQGTAGSLRVPYTLKGVLRQNEIVRLF